MVAALVAAIGVRAPLTRQADPPTVVLDVVLSRSDGRPVTGLVAADFEVLSNGRRQTVAFVSSDPQPLSVVVMIDLTASARRAWKTSTSGVADAFAASMQPQDRVRFGGIATAVTLGPWSTDLRTIAQDAERTVLATKKEDEYGQSPIWDATDVALEALSGEVGRRAIVLVTDGQATGNVRGLEDVRRRAAALGISVNVIAAQAAGLPGLNSATLMLRQLAGMSGGVSIAFSETAARGGVPLSAVAGRLLSDLRGSYRLGFIPDRSDGQLHPIAVRVKTPGVTARAREQYLAGRGPDARKENR
jgi:VWFA-related protein